MRVGTWAASTGETSITREDLENIVTSAATGQLDKAVIKIGHTDPRFANPDWDGEPAYGQVTNLAVDDENGGTLYGDYVNVPAELAEKMPSAYPFRSVEISWGVKLKDAAGKVARTFKAVLTGLALLGQSAPAVKGLADVHAALSDALSGATATAERSSVFTAGQFAFDAGHTETTLRRTLQNALDAARTTEDPFADHWVEDYDDGHVFYHHGEKGMVRRAYSLDGDGAVTLTGAAEPVVEKRVFTPVADTTPVPPAESVANHSEHVSAPEGVTKAKSTKTEVTTVALLEKYRKQLGLPETATADDILAALDAANNEPVADDAKPEAKKDAKKADAKADAKKDDAEPEAEKAKEPVAALSAEPTPSVTVSAVAFSAMQVDVAALRAENATFRAGEDSKRRNSIITSALSEGRLHPTEEKTWRDALNSNEEVTVSLLSARQPMFSVAEAGYDLAPNARDARTAVAEAQIKAENSLFGIGE